MWRPHFPILFAHTKKLFYNYEVSNFILRYCAGQSQGEKKKKLGCLFSAGCAYTFPNLAHRDIFFQKERKKDDEIVPTQSETTLPVWYELFFKTRSAHQICDIKEPDYGKGVHRSHSDISCHEQTGEKPFTN